MRAMVVGARGQLGDALTVRLAQRLAWAGGRGELDVADAAAVSTRVEDVKPDVIFNAAAYNAVDRAEDDPTSAFAVNAFAPLYLARAARSVGALLIHVSTDYVFDGASRRAYSEVDSPAPRSVYGASKLSGENLVAGSGADHVIVRTSGVFGVGGSRAKGGSFPERILARARAGEALRIVDDQVLSPTYAPDLAVRLLELVANGARGLVHATGAGETSWHGFAAATLEIAGIDAQIEKIATGDLKAAAARPPYSVLTSGRSGELGLAPMRPWREALTEMLEEA